MEGTLLERASSGCSSASCEATPMKQVLGRVLRISVSCSVCCMFLALESSKCVMLEVGHLAPVAFAGSVSRALV